jgi:hypothetical protein
MKLIEIVTPNEEKKEEFCDELPAFLRPQAGPKLSRRERRKIAHSVRTGQKPAFLKKQAE